MTDHHATKELNPAPLEKPTSLLRPSVIPAAILASLSFIGLVGMTFQLLIVGYYNIQYGWIEMDPAQPELSRLAITPLHVLQWQSALWGYVAGVVSAYAWYLSRWRIACIGAALFILFMFVSGWLNTV